MSTKPFAQGKEGICPREVRVLCGCGLYSHRETAYKKSVWIYQREQRNWSSAARPSRDLLFIKLWAATFRMPEMKKSVLKT